VTHRINPLGSWIPPEAPVAFPSSPNISEYRHRLIHDSRTVPSTQGRSPHRIAQGGNVLRRANARWPRGASRGPQSRCGVAGSTSASLKALLRIAFRARREHCRGSSIVDGGFGAPRRVTWLCPWTVSLRQPLVKSDLSRLGQSAPNGATLIADSLHNSTKSRRVFWISRRQNSPSHTLGVKHSGNPRLSPEPHQGAPRWAQ
jgi:hypothetical protein